MNGPLRSGFPTWRVLGLDEELHCSRNNALPITGDQVLAEVGNDGDSRPRESAELRVRAAWRHIVIASSLIALHWSAFVTPVDIDDFFPADTFPVTQ